MPDEEKALKERLDLILEKLHSKAEEARIANENKNPYAELKALNELLKTLDEYEIEFENLKARLRQKGDLK